MIRLLKKSEIVASQNLEKTREIQEGLKLTRRVDSLRELVATEEQTLEKFRSDMLAGIGKEISELDGKKENLKIELVYLREELSKETTLSKAERKNLEILKANLEQRKAVLDDKAEELALAEIDIAIATKEAKDSLARTLSHEEISNNLHLAAENLRTEASQKLSNAQEIEKRVLKNKEDVEKEFSVRSETILSKEKSLIMREEEVSISARDLANERLRIADREKTLERALTRLKNNRLA